MAEREVINTETKYIITMSQTELNLLSAMLGPWISEIKRFPATFSDRTEATNLFIDLFNIHPIDMG